MKDLKETLFLAARIVQDAAAKASNTDDRLKAAISFSALYAVIEAAGLTEEYVEYLNN